MTFLSRLFQKLYSWKNNKVITLDEDFGAKKLGKDRSKMVCLYIPKYNLYVLGPD